MGAISERDLKAFSDVMSLGSAAHAVVYGSRRQDRDIDLLIVDPRTSSHCYIELGRFDILLLSPSRLEALATRLDPVVTEPLLTGELVSGDHQAWDDYVMALRSRRPDRSCASHAMIRSLEETIHTQRIAETPPDARVSTDVSSIWQGLSWAISYMSFARLYTSPNAESVTLSSLIHDRLILIPEFWHSRARHKEHGTSPDEEESRRFWREWQGYLMQNGHEIEASDAGT